MTGPATDELARVVAWIRERHPGVPPIGPTDDLIESRLIDSLQFLEFLLLIERLSGRPVDVDALNLDDFRTLERIDRVFLRRDAEQVGEPAPPAGRPDR